MHFNFNISQKEVVEQGYLGILSFEDVAILTWMTIFFHDEDCYKKDVRFGWFAHTKILTEIPMLNCGKDAVYRRVKKLVEHGFLEPHPENQKSGSSYYAISKKALALSSNKGTSGENTVGKTRQYVAEQLPSGENTEPSGENAGEPPAKTPVDPRRKHRTIIYTNDNNTNDNSLPKGKNIEKDLTFQINFPFSSENFASAWEGWLEYKKDYFKFVYKSEKSMQAAVNVLYRMADKDEQVALEIIEYTKSREWEGFVKPDYSKKNTKGMPVLPEPEHWELLKKTFFAFTVENNKPEPSFDGTAPDNLRSVLESLKKRANDHGLQWTEPVAVKKLTNFLHMAFSDPWLQDHWLITHINAKKDIIFDRLLNGTALKNIVGAQKNKINGKPIPRTAGKDIEFDKA